MIFYSHFEGAETPVSSTITGLKVTFSDQVSWIGMHDFAVEVGGLDVMPGLTRVNGPLDFSNLTAGQYGTSSGYDDNDGLWDNDAWDDGDNPITNSPHWSPNASTPLIVYIKFSSAVTVGKVKAFINSVVARGLPNVALEDQSGNPISITSPTSLSDSIYTSGSDRAYEWVVT